MREQLDLVSLCCRAPVDLSPRGYLCELCNELCEAVRPDRGVPFDPDRKVWVRRNPDNSPMGK